MFLKPPFPRWSHCNAGCIGGGSNLCASHQKPILLSSPRYYSTDSSAKATKSFYEILNISEDATQEEVKSAYYSLSKAFHPDMNKDCEDAAVRFQEVSDAYEVLGNYYLRKKYDKGLLPTGAAKADSSERGFTSPPIEHAKFYESRLTRRSLSSIGKAAVPTHDFDSWSQAHYSKTIQSQTQAKKSRLEKKDYLEKSKFADKIEFLFLICTFLGVTASVFLMKLSRKEKELVSPKT